MRGRDAGSRIVTVCGGVVVALALIAAPAQAAKLRTASASATAVGAFDPVTARASCPKGTQAVSGGYATTVPDVPTHWLNVHESLRVGNRVWQVSAVQSFSGTDTLTAYAYCEELKAKVRTRSAQVALPANPTEGAVVQASCPKGSRALSGGFATEAANVSDASLVTRSIGAGGTRWVVDATRLAGTAARSLFAHVYCAEVGKQPRRSEDAAVVGPLGSQHTATTPACPKKTTARAGGFATSTPVGGLLNAALVYETRRAGAAWSSSATPSSVATSITLVTDAYCR